MAFNGDVVHADGLVSDGDLVFADLHLCRCGYDVARIAIARSREHGTDIDTVDRDFRGNPVVLLDENFCGNIVNGGLFDFDRKRDAASISGLGVFAARKVCAFGNGCAAQIFGFVSCWCGIS